MFDTLWWSDAAYLYLNSMAWRHGINTLRLRQNGCHFADDSFKCISWNKMHEFQLMPVPLLQILSVNQYELAFVAYRTASNDFNYFVLVRCHFRISSQANTNVLKCSKHSYWPCESKPIRIASYCIAERHINLCQFLLVRISSLYIRINLLYIRSGIPRLSAVTQ